MLGKNLLTLGQQLHWVSKPFSAFLNQSFLLKLFSTSFVLLLFQILLILKNSIKLVIIVLMWWRAAISVTKSNANISIWNNKQRSSHYNPVDMYVYKTKSKVPEIALLLWVMYSDIILLYFISKPTDHNQLNWFPDPLAEHSYNLKDMNQRFLEEGAKFTPFFNTVWKFTPSWKRVFVLVWYYHH